MLRAQQPAQPDAEGFRVLIVAHGQRDLEVLVRVHSVGINEMAVAQRAGIAQNAHHFVLSGQQMHEVEVSMDRLSKG